MVRREGGDRFIFPIFVDTARRRSAMHDFLVADWGIGDRVVHYGGKGERDTSLQQQVLLLEADGDRRQSDFFCFLRKLALGRD
jgi:hypothetical protein